MATWAYDNRRNIDIGVFLKKKTIDSIISLQFNLGGCVAQHTTAEQGILTLAFCAHSMHETETLKAQELAKEKNVATRSYKELLKLTRTMVRIPTSSYQDINRNISTFCAFFWTLFGDVCNYCKEVVMVLQILKLADVYAMRDSNNTEVCCRIILATPNEERQILTRNC